MRTVEFPAEAESVFEIAAGLIDVAVVEFKFAGNEFRGCA